VISCRHDGYHSATSRYDRINGVLRFVLACDACGAELHEVVSIRYRPRLKPAEASSLAA
jgi:hypothetical protein